MSRSPWIGFSVWKLGALAGAIVVSAVVASAGQSLSIRNAQLSVAVRARDAAYEIRVQKLPRPVLVARVGALVDHHWLSSSDYPRHTGVESAFQDALGAGLQLTVTFSGAKEKPDLICILRLYDQRPLGDLEVHVKNTTPKAMTVQAIRTVNAIGEPRVDLGGAEAQYRVMSDAFSEDPTMKITDLVDAPDGIHRGIGSQLIYSQESKQSLLLAALTSKRFLTILRLHVAKTRTSEPRITSYEVDSTGTTEIMKERDLRDAPAEQQIELSLQVPPGTELPGERLAFAAGSEYFRQLEGYGEAIRVLQQARFSPVNLVGWWSWTAYYAGITQETALTNARWLAEHLRALGYDYFHIDEGYQYARGEYTTPNATQFPEGVMRLGREVCRLGLKLGVWAAPFEVSGRAWVYEHHKDWLVRDARGMPIQIGFVGPGTTDPLFVLDTTHPDAQAYLRQTYRTLTREWGVRYIKLDFMDATAVEGYYHRPNTTALEAQRVGLEIIREAVGDDVLLDKDGSPMLNPVGLVDEGRISGDTGHSFRTIKNAAPNIAARYYMNGNFYRTDPDAFTVSRQVIPQQGWNESQAPLTLDEAKVSIVLSAVSGGMFEIGDDLPTLGADADRLALVKNSDLLQMARLGRAAVPLDLMTFRPEDEIPSVFLLQEDSRQTILAVFNWTEQARSHTFTLSDLRLPTGHDYKIVDALDHNGPVDFNGESLALESQPPHSVRLIRIVDTTVGAAPPRITVQIPTAVEAGKAFKCRAETDSNGVPGLGYHWYFGDGSSAEGPSVSHAYTRAADYHVRLVVEGLDGIPAQQEVTVSVSGSVKTEFNLPQNRRYQEKPDHE